MEIGTALTKDHRRTEDELQLLFTFFRPEGQLDSTVMQQLTTMTQLCGLRDPLSVLMLETSAPGGEKLPGTLERFDFKCAQSTGSTDAASAGDPDYVELKDLAASLCDSEKTRTWDEGRQSTAGIRRPLRLRICDCLIIQYPVHSRGRSIHIHPCVKLIISKEKKSCALRITYAVSFARAND